MKLLLADFNGVLGLYGKVYFPRNKPVILYGENISGKSNVINALRYCINPPGRGGRKGTYSEDKKFAKDEILIPPLEEGGMTLYFQRSNELMKLHYSFRRTSLGVRREECLQIKEKEPPGGDIREYLTGVSWGEPPITKITEIKKELENRRIFPEILDILIAPSNVSNFAKAVSGDIIDIPGLIKKQIEKRRERAHHYKKHLNDLASECIREQDKLEDSLERLQEGLLDHKYKNCSYDREEVKDMFKKGSENLSTLKRGVSKRIEQIPDKRRKIANSHDELADEIKEDQEKLTEISNLLEDKGKISRWIREKKEFKETKKTIDEWRPKIGSLPPRRNVERLTDFDVPRYENLNLSNLKEGEGVRSTFKKLEELKKKAQSINKIAEKYGLSPQNMKGRKEALNNLIESLKSPVEKPKGFKAILFIDDKKSRIGLSLEDIEEISEQPEYMQVSPVPTFFEPGVEKRGLKRKAKEYKSKVEGKRDEIGGAIEKRGKFGNELGKIKKRLPKQLKKEHNHLKRKIKDIKKELKETRDKWNKKYSNLCSDLEIKERSLNFEETEEFEETVNIVCEAHKKGRGKLREKIKNQVSNFEDISAPEEIDEGSVDKLIGRLNRKAEGLRENKKVLKKIRSWLDKNLGDLKEIEEEIKTLNISRIIAVTGGEVFRIIEEKSNVEEIVERLAESIQKNVRSTYKRIFPENNIRFKHISGGEFQCRLNNEPITHPSGSQRAVLSLGIMISLAQSFSFPILLDEASDRFDYNRLPKFLEYIIGVSKNPDNPQICLAMCKSLDIEKNQKVKEKMPETSIYKLDRKSDVEKHIQPIKPDSIFD